MKIQSRFGTKFVDLGDDWQATVVFIDGLVAYGPFASYEEVRRPLTDDEAKGIEAAILAKWPAANPYRFYPC